MSTRTYYLRDRGLPKSFLGSEFHQRRRRSRRKEASHPNTLASAAAEILKPFDANSIPLSSRRRMPSQVVDETPPPLPARDTPAVRPLPPTPQYRDADGFRPPLPPRDLKPPPEPPIPAKRPRIDEGAFYGDVAHPLTLLEQIANGVRLRHVGEETKVEPMSDFQKQLLEAASKQRHVEQTPKSAQSETNALAQRIRFMKDANTGATEPDNEWDDYETTLPVLPFENEFTPQVAAKSTTNEGLTGTINLNANDIGRIAARRRAMQVDSDSEDDDSEWMGDGSLRRRRRCRRSRKGKC